MTSSQDTEKDPSDPTVCKFDSAMANQYAYEKKWDELKAYMWKFYCQDTEAVFSKLALLECKAIDFINEGRYSSASVSFDDDILPLLEAAKEEVGTLAEHLFYLQGVVNISKLPTGETFAVPQYGATKNQSSKFDHAIANGFVAEKNWDDLSRYLELFYSEESLQLFVESEHHAIKLVKDGKATEALASIQALSESLETQYNLTETARLLDHLAFFQESLCGFDEEVIGSFFNNNDVDGLKNYIDGFFQNLPQGVVDRHPVLELIILELQLAVAYEEKNRDMSDQILKSIGELKKVPQGSKFMPSDFGVRIINVDSQKPILDDDDSILKFCLKLESGQLRCLACGHTFPKNRAEATIEDHLTRSAKAKSRKMKMCDAITPRLKELLAECLGSGCTSLKRKRGQTNSDPRSGQKLTNTKVSDDSFSENPLKTSCDTGASVQLYGKKLKEVEMVESDPVSLIANIYIKMSDVAKALKGSGLSGHSCVGHARSCILKLQQLILDESASMLDENGGVSMLTEIGKLEKALEDMVLLFVELPDVSMLSEFIGLVFQLRSACLKKTAKDSQIARDSSSLFIQSSKLLSLCFKLCNPQSILDSSCTETNTVVFMELEEKVVELVKVLLGGSGGVDVNVLNTVSSLRSVAVQLYKIENVFGPTVKELHSCFQMFWCSCIEKIAHPHLSSLAEGARGRSG